MERLTVDRSSSHRGELPTTEPPYPESLLIGRFEASTETESFLAGSPSEFRLNPDSKTESVSGAYCSAAPEVVVAASRLSIWDRDGVFEDVAFFWLRSQIVIITNELLNLTSPSS